MKRYKVVKPYKERDARGTPTGGRPQMDEVVHPSCKDAKRLLENGFIVEMETATIDVPEDRVKRKRGRPKRAKNTRTDK